MAPKMPTLNLLPGEWVKRAACRGSDPDEFFPEQGNRALVAKAVCSRCPVRAECLEFAMRNYERFGIWGGHTAKERRTLRKLRTH